MKILSRFTSASLSMALLVSTYASAADVDAGLSQTTITKNCIISERIQTCWGSAILMPDENALHTAAFYFPFESPFKSTPTITNGINVNGSGHGMTVYAWKADSKSYKGRVNNMYIGQPVNGTITMSYIAIGEPADVQ